jgi:hypothetical protein
MVHRLALVLSVALFGVSPAAPQDHALQGPWKAVTYMIDGVAHPMQGLFIFSKSYYSANVRFKLGADSLDDANGNAGPYEQEGTRIVFKQWVQIHVRPGDRDHPILSRAGPDEVADFQLEGDHLTLIFPSKNRYILQRAAE